MLRRFESIKDCGIFVDFRWSATSLDFERINLIYGANGAGKTSLARALSSLGDNGAGCSKISIRLSAADGSHEHSSANSPDPAFDQVHVFSEDYVTRSHHFGGDTRIDAVLTLGEKSVEDERRAAELVELIASTHGRVQGASASTTSASKALDDAYTSIARNIVATLQRAGGEYQSNGHYSKGTVRGRFSAPHSVWKLLSDGDKEIAQAIVASDERQPVRAMSWSVAPEASLDARIAEVLTKTPLYVVLDTLNDHVEASSWVERGRHIHNGLDQCLFCGGHLTSHRLMQIEQHFSEEVTVVQRETDALISEIQELRGICSRIPRDNSLAGALYSDLREAFLAAGIPLATQMQKLDEWLGEVDSVLKNKRANVVRRVDWVVSTAPSIDGSYVERVLTEHNARAAEHASLVQEAAKKVERHLLKESEAMIAGLVAAANTATLAEAAVREELRLYLAEVSALQNVEGDPLPSAQVMAAELTRILGRNELSFELLPDGKHYRVTRHGESARDLSTGERTAITLVHFLAGVKTAAASSSPAIVVIDDPVSSLDSGSATGISTYIWSEAIAKSHIEQIFLLTHNFELFRQWDIQIDGLPGKRGSKGDAYPSRRYELIASHRAVNGTMRRRPALTNWPPTASVGLKLRSAYHHAFITAAHAYAVIIEDASLENRLDALLLYPNVLRRLLETFLAFKHPTSAGNFTKAMRDVGNLLESLGYAGDADALRLQLTRFTHANSHADSLGADTSSNADEIGGIIAAVFTFMHAVDREHFEGICQVVGIEASQLLLEPPLPTSP